MRPLALHVLAAGALLLTLLAAPPRPAGADPEPARAAIDPDHHISYGVGYDLGLDIRRRLEEDGVPVDVEVLVRAFRDGVSGAAPAAPREDLDAALAELERQVRERQARERYDSDPVFRALADDNDRRGGAFRADYAKREGVAASPSGVLIRVLRSGDSSGPHPAPTDTVSLNYTGRLIDGAIYAQGQGTEIRVDSIMEGGQAVLQRMRPGDRWEVVLPPATGLGLGGRPGEVGPNETLIIDVELLSTRPNP